MGQEDILKILENNPNKWFTAREINKSLKLSKNSSHSFVSLRKSGYVNVRIKIIGCGTERYMYKHKG
tara:strand:- start:223 stop:423 length:201 start_codon:yes stop_codon:yes gene_type:complete